jgi:hypothetical protein
LECNSKAEPTQNTVLVAEEESQGITRPLVSSLVQQGMYLL